MCWWHEALPSSLFAHVAETLVLSALPRSALARLESQLALAPKAESESATEEMGVASDLVDAALISQGADRSTALADTVLDILKESISEIDGVNKRHWLIEIQKLTNRAVNAGPRTAMLLAWAAEMCEFGTIHELNPADSTVSAYIRRALLPLHHVLSSLSDDLESADWRAENLRTQYQQLIATQSVGNQPTIRAALSNFHHFLVNWFDIEPLKVELFGTTGPASVRAEVVWEHELVLAMQCATAHVDADMGLATQIILGIAFEAPARSQELTRLRMCNVKFSQDSAGKYVEIEIARHASSGRLKTPSSQRPLEIRSLELLSLLAIWMERRKRQGAPDNAFLFGDPSDDSKRYRPAAMLAWASRLLKTVTGDPRISMHTLRHTSISRLTSEVWTALSEIDINRIEVIAAHAGHSSGLTTLVVYSHQYETGLRMWLDRSMRERLEISGQAAASLLNKKSEALRKGASRAGKDVSNYAWDLLLQSANEMNAVRASLPFICCLPKRSESGVARDRQLTVGVMESVLQDTINGLFPHTLANRYQLNERALQVTLSVLVEKCSAHAQRTFPRLFARRSTPILELVSAIEALGIDFNRRSQPKYQSFTIALNGNVEDAQLLRGLKSWEKCYQGIYLSAKNPTDLIGLLSLLKSANVDGSALRVCVQSTALGNH